MAEDSEQCKWLHLNFNQFYRLHDMQKEKYFAVCKSASYLKLHD